MVKKLIKYDFKAFAKIMFPAYLVLLGVGALYRFITIFETDGLFYTIFNGSAISILVISMIVCSVMTYIVSVVRFYKGLYTAEGYLSFTLPVTPAAHIFSKLVTTLIFDVLTAAASFLAIVIATAGETFVEIMKAEFYLIGKIFSKVGGQSAIYIIELVILVFVVAATSHLLTFMCISIGQLVNKHKVLLAVGIFFGFYLVRQILGTMFIAIGAVTSFFADIAKFAADNPYTFFHLLFCGIIVLGLILGGVYFFVTKRIMTKRLNLE